MPNLENVEYDVKNEAMVLFFCSASRYDDIPIIGNLGPKYLLHIIGNVHSNVESIVSEFGINNAIVEVNLFINVMFKSSFHGEQSASVEQNTNCNRCGTPTYLQRWSRAPVIEANSFHLKEINLR